MRTLILKSLFTLSIIFIISGCKKKTPAATATPSSSTGPITAKKYSGILTAQTATTLSGGAFLSSRQTAYFSSKDVPVINDSFYVKVNSVFVGSDSLFFDTNGKTYYGSYPASTPTMWTIKGANNIPSFSYTDKQVTPALKSYSFPDTVSLDAGATLKINGITNTTLAYFTITGMYSYTATLAPGSSTIFITPEVLKAAVSSTYEFIVLSLENAHVINIDGKNFKVAKQAHYAKDFYVKP